MAQSASELMKLTDITFFIFAVFDVRNWATNTPQLSQNHKTGSYCAYFHCACAETAI